MATQIDFYHLKNPTSSWLQFVCRLIEKILKENKRVWIYSTNQTRLTQLDEFLWTYNDISFIPHSLNPEKVWLDTCPVILSEHQPENPEHYILLNMDIGVPEFYLLFNRVLEIIPVENDLKQAARQRYAIYQKQNQHPVVHEIAS